jgi:hypothetical protein
LSGYLRGALIEPIDKTLWFSKFTLGAEEEFQIVDSQTRELRSHVSEILAEGKTLLDEQLKPEKLGREGQQAS